MLRSFALEVSPEHRQDYEATLAFLASPEGTEILEGLGREGLERYTVIQRGELAFDVDLESETERALDLLRADARVWPLTWVPRAAAAPAPDPEASRQVRFQWRRTVAH